MDNKTGAVTAILAKKPSCDGNHCGDLTKANRQMGSAFKLFPYYLYLNEPGVNEHTMIAGQQHTEGWFPSESHGTPPEQTSVLNAITHSYNGAVANLIYDRKIHFEDLNDLARKFGITLNEPYSISDKAMSTIGSSGSVFSLVKAYNAIADDGLVKKPFYILEIRDVHNKLLWERDGKIQPIDYLNKSTCRELKNCFKNVVSNGTAASVRANYSLPDAGGKTGTTNNEVDVWYIGFNSNTTMGIWMGYPLTSQISSGMRSRDCAELWGKIMRNVR
ncbi:MAG: hypothetical protein IPN14_17065 [Bacteroidetes bacterium]|nr:hypothetical protein [Bacteroidota bacterium]